MHAVATLATIAERLTIMVLLLDGCDTVDDCNR